MQAGKTLVQKRKHPVFDSVHDITCSSHPLMVDGKMEDETIAVARCLSRELKITRSMYESIEKKGFVIYKAKDNAGHIEHEYCTFYSIQANQKVNPPSEFAYGHELVDTVQLQNVLSRPTIAPWVKAGAHLL